MLAYFLKVNIAIALFYAFYRLFFYKDTFFTWRRTALLCFFAVSAVYPLLNIQAWVAERESMIAMADLYADIILPEFILESDPSPHSTAFDWKSALIQYANIIYWGVVILLTIRLLSQLAGIISLLFHSRKVRIGNEHVRLLPQPGTPFSFFHWIFIHPTLHTEEELSEILTHEQAHANQWHSIDVLISETMCILCWFNPFIWLMKREIRTNLEYLADHRVLESGYNSKSYQYHLLGLSHQKVTATIYNNFNVLPLKKRIQMMNKKRTREIGRSKYLLFLPLAALLLIISNIETVARTTKDMAKEVIEAVEETLVSNSQPATTSTSQPEVIMDDKWQNMLPPINSTDSLLFEVVEEMPEFPDGGITGLMDYLSKNIKYPVNAQKNGTQGRVTVQFVVNKDGSISKAGVLRGVDPELDSEAVRVINSMPHWKPGRQRGEAVRVKYTVPIQFRLPKTEYTSIPKMEELTVVGYSPTSAEAMQNESEVYEIVEQMPAFPNGMPGLMAHLSKSIKYPTDAQKEQIEGRVIVKVVIDEAGNITNSQILQSVHPLLDAEALRVVNLMPPWKPGMQKGKAVRVTYTFPVLFRLQ